MRFLYDVISYFIINYKGELFLKRIVGAMLVFVLLSGMIPITAFAVNTYVINGVSISYTDHDSTSDGCFDL